MTQDEIIEMASSRAWHGNVEGWTFNSYEELEAFAKLVVDKAFEQGFYAGFKASGEGWNGECPFNELGLDIQQDESVQHELKEAIRARGQA